MKKLFIGVIGIVLAAVIIIRIVQATADQEPPPDVEEIRRQSGVPVVVPDLQSPARYE